ncbi:hypothetical protein CRUP_014298 [Coryphaenoides rupestris]|nr:hypothetical protein CRUP_014298 [Coryphaenoides rupestris]
MEKKLRLRRASETASISPPGSSTGSPHRLICTKADSGVSNYRRLAAFRDTQHPDVIPYHAYHTHTHLHDGGQSRGTLSPYSQCAVFHNDGLLTYKAAGGWHPELSRVYGRPLRTWALGRRTLDAQRCVGTESESVLPAPSGVAERGRCRRTLPLRRTL